MFKRIFELLLVSCVVAGAAWAASDPFIGEWKLNPSRSKLTDVMKVASVGGNKYEFDFGRGNETIVVDGTDQPGHLGSTLSVSPEGPNTWKVVRKRNGRVLITATWKLSKDGYTLTDDFRGLQSNGSPYNLNYVYKRTGRGSGFTGTWQSTSEAVNSVVMLHVRPYEGSGLSFTDPSGTRNLKFDGKDYPTVGPNATPGSAISARRASAHAVEVTDKFNGKTIDTRQFRLSSDFKTLTMTERTADRSEPDIYVYERQ